MEIFLIIFSSVSTTCLIFSLFVIKRAYDSNDKLEDKNRKLNKELDDINNVFDISVGDKALLHNYGLEYTSKKQSFKITYEVDILEVSNTSVKVKATNFIPSCEVGRNPSNKSGILAFMDGKWILRKDIDLVVNDAMRRDDKLSKLGIC